MVFLCLVVGLSVALFVALSPSILWQIWCFVFGGRLLLFGSWLFSVVVLAFVGLVSFLGGVSFFPAVVIFRTFVTSCVDVV